MPLEHSSGETEQAVGDVVLELNKDVLAGDRGLHHEVLRNCQSRSLKIKGLLEKIKLGADSPNVCNFVSRAPIKIILENASSS